ncbi:MAG: cell division protein SepF [Sporomusaceae bacterium]|nr:cell division protein SepF [Sporomusaceae bacterium]
MKIMEKVWGSLGIIEPVETEEDRLRQEEPDSKLSKKNNLVNLNNSQKPIKVIVVEPHSFDDAQQISDHLKNRKPVVVNFENTDKEIAKRMVDFISGTTYALNGNIQKIGNNIFFCVPSNVDITYSGREDGADKSVLSWMNK